MTKLVLSLALLLSILAGSSMAEKFDFFYLVQQWPGSFCDTRQGCCFPDTGKPAADFGIHGLWPNYAKCRGRTGGVARAVLGDDAFFSIVGRRGKCWPEYCDNDNPLSPWEIRDLVTSLDRNWPTLSCKSGRSLEFWSYEWKKHGTCSNLEQHEYFEATLALKARHNLTAILAGAGIVPSDTRTYPRVASRTPSPRGPGSRRTWSATATPTARRSCSRCTSAWTAPGRSSSTARCPCPASAPTGSSCPSSDRVLTHA